MPHLVTGAAAAVAFLVAGIVNLRGSAATRADFVRWGYPAWWCLVTGTIEIGTAALVAWPATRWPGLVVAALVVAAAVLTVLWHRDLSHLVPLSAYAALVAAAWFL